MNESTIPLILWEDSAAAYTREEPVSGEQILEEAAPPERKPRRAVIFIHGIFSSHNTFAAMRKQMGEYEDFKGVEFYYFDYPFNESMETNGSRLADALIFCGFTTDDYVALVGHSMGGLIARFAILSKPMVFVRILFLLGTPNSGAMRLSQLSALAQLAHITTKRVFSLFPRRQGIVSLSNAAALIEERRHVFSNAAEIDYVSIPGKFYNNDRSYWELPKRPDGAPFSVLEGLLLRGGFIRMERPHDGIVEESSNNLMHSPRGTEKEDSYGGYRGTRRATYAHLSLAACSDLNHVEIHSNEIVIQAVSHLIWMRLSDETKMAAVLENWYTSLSSGDRLDFGVRMAFEA